MWGLGLGHHAQRGPADAAARGEVRCHALQAEQEQGRGDQVAGLDDDQQQFGGGHARSSGTGIWGLGTGEKQESRAIQINALDLSPPPSPPPPTPPPFTPCPPAFIRTTHLRTPAPHSPLLYRLLLSKTQSQPNISI